MSTRIAVSIATMSCRQVRDEPQSGTLNRRNTERASAFGASIKGVFCPTGKSVIWLSSPRAKNIPLNTSGKSTLQLPPSRPTQRGVSRSSRTLGTGCGGRGRAGDERRARGRRSRVVLTPRRWRQVCENKRRRRWQKSPVTGESTKQAVKTIARGKPVEPVNLW